MERFKEGLEVWGLGREVWRSFEFGGRKRERDYVLVRQLDSLRRIEEHFSKVIWILGLILNILRFWMHLFLLILLWETCGLRWLVRYGGTWIIVYLKVEWLITLKFSLWHRLRFGHGSHQRYRQLISHSLIGVLNPWYVCILFSFYVKGCFLCFFYYWLRWDRE